MMWFVVIAIDCLAQSFRNKFGYRHKWLIKLVSVMWFVAISIDCLVQPFRRKIDGLESNSG